MSAMQRPFLTPEPEAPFYQRLAATLESMIQGHSLRPGDRIPSVRHFSAQQRVSIPTALRAYETLETRGLIEARPKSGFFVRSRQADFVRIPTFAARAPEVTDFANLDPFDSLFSPAATAGLVPLGVALADPSLLPGEKLAREMGVIARRLGPKSTNYDFAPGSEALRGELARRSLDWGCALQRDDFIIVNGGTEALSLALRATCKPGDTVIVESPTYFGLAQMIRELGLNGLPIPVESVNGMDLDAVEKAVSHQRIAACVSIANFHNPVGFLMPEDRKQQLLALLAKRSIPLIEDDVYGDLQHNGARPRCIKAFDPNGVVLLCGSFSKTLAPGYRVGYIAAGRWHSQVLRLKQISTLSNALLPSLAIAEYLRNGGYDRYLRSIRQTYRRQIGRVREAIVDSFPPGIGLSRPLGSFLLWCELPPQVDSMELFQRARREGISIAPGPLFSPDGGSFKNFIRINCGFPMTAATDRAVGLLGHLVKGLLK